MREREKTWDNRLVDNQKMRGGKEDSHINFHKLSTYQAYWGGQIGWFVQFMFYVLYLPTNGSIWKKKIKI